MPVPVTSTLATPVDAGPGLVGVPARSTEELARTTLPGDPVPLPVHSALVILKTPEGTRAVPAARIEEILFRDGMKTEVAVEEERDLLTLRLDWKGAKPPATAEVGMGYLQKGLRWIPSYRIEILGGGKVSVRLQGTLINELADLEGVTAHLVVGVPSFDFAGSPDPVGLQGTLARLSPFFQNAQGGALTNAAIASNYVVTQQAMRMGESRGGEGGGGGDEEGSGADGEKSEDLFLFTLRGVTLRRGERMVVPVSETVLPYEDAWALDLPFTPPAEMRQGNQDPRLAALLRMMARPKVMHRLCIRNTGTAPLTTAPALLLKEGRVLGQGTMTYAAPGSTVDLDVTAAVDIRVTKSERETGRTPAAMNWNGRKYGRIDLAGTVTLENRFDRPVTVAVTRWVLGAVDSVEGGASGPPVTRRAGPHWRGGGRGSGSARTTSGGAGPAGPDSPRGGPGGTGPRGGATSTGRGRSPGAWPSNRGRRRASATPGTTSGIRILPMTRARVLVVEDDPAVRRGIVDALRWGGYEPLEAAAGETGLRAALAREVDLVLLDLLLPRRDGFSVLEEVRRARPALPVIVLTARGAEEDRVRGLRGGADDYVVKPFSAKELLARVEAVLRRSPARPRGTGSLAVAGRTLDFERREVRFADGGRAELPEKEAAFLAYLAAHRGRAVPREELLERVWGIDPGNLETRTVDMLVARLRERLREPAAAPEVVLTVRGEGYMLALPGGEG